MAHDLVIFDCDGVLIDSEVLGCRAEAACFASIGIDITAEQLMHDYIGINVKTMLADLRTRRDRPVPELPADFAETLHQAVLAAFEAELQPMPGIDAVLRSLASPRCVASGSSPERLYRSLSLTGLLRYFDPHIFSATQVARGKPAPDLFLLAAAQMQTAPNACVVIEDSVPGVQAARAAGMRVIGFTGGSHCPPGHAEQLRANGAAAICPDMRTLHSLL